MTDPIVEEVHKARDEYASRFNYDLGAMVQDLREQARRRRLEASHARPKIVDIKPRLSAQITS